MAWVEKAHSAHPVPSPCYMQGCQPANQTAQSHIQPGLECLHGSITASLGNLFSVSPPSGWKNFLLISMSWLLVEKGCGSSSVPTARAESPIIA